MVGRFAPFVQSLSRHAATAPFTQGSLLDSLQRKPFGLSPNAVICPTYANIKQNSMVYKDARISGDPCDAGVGSEVVYRVQHKDLVDILALDYLGYGVGVISEVDHDDLAVVVGKERHK